MGLERKSSIDTEPRTLTLHQLEVAREAALFVMSTRSEEEALRIFTTGLKSASESSSSRRDDDDVDGFDLYEEFEDCCDQPSWLVIKEVSSAPF